MFLRLFSLVFSFVVVLVSCVSQQNPVAPPEEVRKPVEPRKINALPEVVPTKESWVTFDQAVEQNMDGLTQNPNSEELLEAGRKFVEHRKKFGTSKAVLLSCAESEENPFCVAYRFKSSPKIYTGRRTKNKANKNEVQKKLLSKNYDALKTYDFQSLLAGAKKVPIEKLKQISKETADYPGCLSEEIYIALGSMMEIDFPNEDSVTLNDQLFTRARTCFNGELTSRVTFRLGMFKVWKNHCDEAIPLFELALKNPAIRGLHSRSSYWLEKCRPKTADAVTAMNPTDFYNNFPQSFHSLLADDGPTPIAYNLLAANVSPGIQFRTTNNKDLNGYLDAVDILIRLGEQTTAFSLLESFKAEKWQNEDSHLLLYLALTCNRVQAGLLKFQVLSTVFDQSPTFKTVSTMKLYYPAWYKDVIAEHKDVVNQYLILALVRQESAFNRMAHSPAGARGLMQLLPTTARTFGRTKKNELFDPKKNIKSGVNFFAYLLKRYNNQVPMALAAYNAGPLVVDEWIKRYPTDNPLLFIDMIPYRETRDYVSTILRNWYWYSQLYDKSYPTQSKN